MNHPQDILWIQYAAGHADSSLQQQLTEHLQQCPRCARRLEELRQTWAAMDHWKPPVPTTDLTSSVLAELNRSQPAPTTFSYFFKVPLPLRIAASIAIAASLGYSAGYLSRNPSTPAQDSMAAAGDALHLEVLSQPGPVGLADVLLSSTTDLAQEDAG